MAGGPKSQDSGADRGRAGLPSAWDRHALRAHRGGSQRRGGPSPASDRSADPAAPRGLPRGTQGAERRGALHGRCQGLRRGRAPCGPAAAFLYGLLKGRLPPPRGDRAHAAQGGRGEDEARPSKSARGDHPARDPDHHGGPHAGRSRRRDRRGQARARMSRGRRQVRHHTGAGRGRARPPPNAKAVVTLRKVLRGEVQVVLSGLERSFLALVRDAHLPLPLTNRAAGGRRVDCPLAGAAADRRARRLQLPQQPLLLGAGPAPRTRSPRPRRPASPLYPRRRVRPPGFGRGGAATAARPVTGSRDTGGCPRRRGAPVSCAPSAVETPQSCPGAVESRPTSSPPRPWRRPREPLPPTRPRGACELSRVLPPGSVENPPTSFFPPRPGASLERAAPRPVRPRPMRCAPRAGAARRPGAPARPDGRLSSAR